MKAAVLERIGSIQIEHRPEPKVRDGDVVLEVEVCGVCRTDMKSYTAGHRDLRLPRVLGHEITGTVVETAGRSTVFRPGNRVQVAPGIPCGSCLWCRQGLDHLCSSMEVMGFHCDGGFQEYLHIPARAVDTGIINLIPDEMSFETACMAEPLACAINMQDRLRLCSGDAVLIWGGGPLGLLNARLAYLRGASCIVMVEANPARLSRLRGLAGRFCLSNEPEHLPELLHSVTGRGTADVVIPCCPDPDALRLSLPICSKRGRIGLFSGLAPAPVLTNDEWNLVHYLELTVSGAFGCSIGNNRAALQCLHTGDVTVQDLITRRIGLLQLQSTLDAFTAGEDMKIIIDMRKGR